MQVLDQVVNDFAVWLKFHLIFDSAGSGNLQWLSRLDVS